MINQEVKLASVLLIEYFQKESGLQYRIDPLLQGFGAMIKPDAAYKTRLEDVNMLVPLCRKNQIDKQDYYLGIALDQNGIFSAYDLHCESQVSFIATSPRIIDFSFVGNSFRLITGRNFFDVTNLLITIDSLDCSRFGIQIEGDVAQALLN